jgi:hypothetical protein
LYKQFNYVFTLHALNTEKLNPPTDATSALVRFFINQHPIAKTTISLVFDFYHYNQSYSNIDWQLWLHLPECFYYKV